MIPAGYMYKFAGGPPTHLTAEGVVDIFSVGACSGSNSPFFAEYINYWKHNGYWFFNSPEVIEQIASDENIDLSAMTLFYYEFYEFEFDLNDDPGNSHHVEGWAVFEPTSDFVTDVSLPEQKRLAGYDVTEYVYSSSPGCSLLSCSNLAARFAVNSHCLFDTLDQAKQAVESGLFNAMEPGPYRILAVYEIGKPIKTGTGIRI
jgi:hypothetical protein